MINLGTCGVHTTHITLKHENKASGWKMKKKKKMSSLRKIFHESQGCPEDYRKQTDTNGREFPLLIVSHRCVENELVGWKTRAILPNAF